MLTTTQTKLKERLVGALQADERIAAIWAEGSVARGEADRYSDIDLHALHEGNVVQDLPRILAAAGKVVLLRTTPGTTISTGVMADGLRFDVVLESEADLKRPRAAFEVLFERRPGALADLNRSTQVATPRADRVAMVLSEFWRCYGLLPAVLGRGELLSAFQGHALMLGMAAEIAMACEGRARQAGAKRLNQFLRDADRERLEAAAPEGAGARALARAQHSLADIVAERGRLCAERYGFPYPADLEQAVRGHVQEELALLGIDLG